LKTIEHRRSHDPPLDLVVLLLPVPNTEPDRASRLTVTTEREGVVLLPGGVVVVVLVTLSETPVPLSLGGETTGLSVLVNGVGDPVDSGITTDGLVLGAK